jgi:hypothetical protein
MSDELEYAKIMKKAHGVVRTVDADWDGTASDWFALTAGAPIKGLMFKDLVTGDLTIHVSDTAAGTDAYLLGVAEDMTGAVDERAYFVPELAPFKFARITSTGTQANGIIKIIESA